VLDAATEYICPGARFGQAEQVDRLHNRCPVVEAEVGVDGLDVAHPRSIRLRAAGGSSPGSALFGVHIAVRVTALKPINENPCLLDVAPQRGCFQRHLPTAPVGDTLAFDPRQPTGHLAQLNLQGADELHGLGGLQSTHGVIFAH
jgi:hypothetical protein